MGKDMKALFHDPGSLIARSILDDAGVMAYYPNRFQKAFVKAKYPDHNKDFNSCNGWDCPCVHDSVHDGSTPDDSWCWAGSYWWHLVQMKNIHGSLARLIQ